MDLRDAVRADGEGAVETLPLVPLRDNVVFPHQLAPLGAGRPRSVAALESAVQHGTGIVLAIQRDASQDDVHLEDLHAIATVAAIGALRRMPNGGAQALVEGQRRVRIVGLDTSDGSWTATIVNVETAVPDGESEVEALGGSVKALFGEYAAAGAAVAPEVAVALARTTDLGRIADIASAAPDIPATDRVELLQEIDVATRLRTLVPLLAKQVEVAQLKSRIQEDVARTINKSQREAILREQLRAVRRELEELQGRGDEDGEDDLVARVEKAGMPAAVHQRALKEVHRLEQIPQASPELGMVRSYVDWLLDLPWGQPPAENVDIDRAARVLDEDHYGLEKVKERIVEWLAVRQRTQRRLEERDRRDAEAAAQALADAPAADRPSPDVAPIDAPSTAEPRAEDVARPRALQTPILCLVGPPGVGKTSLGRSIARALDRRFVRLSLGGVRDEAEIRGHRRTYIGALPGRIIQSMKQAGTINPVIMLDEIDKVGADFRGDPSASLLEVLDPEQNREFSDHYLEVGYDLSHVLFITTANVAETISPPLRDRMEMIRIPGYTEEEKIGISERHLLIRQREQHGLDEDELAIDHDALVQVVRGWTREAGVRQLDRTIAQLARKVPRVLSEREAAGEERPGVVIHVPDLEEYLGPQRFDYGEAELEDQVGAVTGVVVSEVGGDIVTIEAIAIEGRNDLLITGQLGSVMEESARAALSWARVHSGEFGAPKGFFDGHGIHLHVPAGAIPKDGPSAGVTMATALVSLASGRRVRRDVAMTGEITLRGRILPIGGVRDKLLAAHRSGLRTFLLPRKNERDLRDVDPAVLRDMQVHAVDSIDEVLEHALVPAGESGRDRSRTRLGFRMPEIERIPDVVPLPAAGMDVAPDTAPPAAAETAEA